MYLHIPVVLKHFYCVLNRIKIWKTLFGMLLLFFCQCTKFTNLNKILFIYLFNYDIDGVLSDSIMYSEFNSVYKFFILKEHPWLFLSFLTKLFRKDQQFHNFSPEKKPINHKEKYTYFLRSWNFRPVALHLKICRNKPSKRIFLSTSRWGSLFVHFTTIDSGIPGQKLQFSVMWNIVKCRGDGKLCSNSTRYSR